MRDDDGMAPTAGDGPDRPDEAPETPEAQEDDGAGPEDGRASLERLRERILEVDEALVRLVGERRQLVLDIARRKTAAGRPVMDPSREAKVVRRAAALAREEGIDEEMVRDVIWRIIASARDEQERRTRWGPPARLDPRPEDANAGGTTAPEESDPNDR